MELSVAKQLIERPFSQSHSPAVWADLGAGDGLFTRALSELLPTQSEIIAVDKDQKALNRIRIASGVTLKTIVGDFEHADFRQSTLDGVLMANSLHYVSNQVEFLNKIRLKFLKPSGALLIVEYNLQRANPWVPYPVDKTQLTRLAKTASYSSVSFLHSVPSRLNNSEIYSAILHLS